MSELFAVPLLLGFVAFLIGWAAAKFSAYVGLSAAGLDAPAHDHKIRALEASLRVSKKDADETIVRLESSTQELQTLRTSIDDLEQTVQIRDVELEEMRQAVTDECKKVAELRRALTDRAEETIRANVDARDSKTELSVLKAGASVMIDEVGRLESEHEEMTNRLKSLDKDPFDDLSDDDLEADGAPADQYLPDC